MSTEGSPPGPRPPEGILGGILSFSIEHRSGVVLATLVAALVGVFALFRLPIDAVPDITNKQVQINTMAPSLSPVEIEKQVTFLIEGALSGIPGLSYTRSLSRNGFSQVTAVFEDRVDVYFARQQVTERLAEVEEALPPGSDPVMGPISTGLGEVLMWVVEYQRWQPDGSYRTPEGELLRTATERAAYLRTVQDWIIRFQMKSVPGVAGIDSIGGYVKQYHVSPDPARLVAYGLGFQEVLEALGKNNASTGAGFIEHHGEAYQVRASGRIPRSRWDPSSAPGVPARTGARRWWAPCSCAWARTAASWRGRQPSAWARSAGASRPGSRSGWCWIAPRWWMRPCGRCGTTSRRGRSWSSSSSS
jgi:cobalt-zinc-cadmium resistance protein CzcA